MWRAGPRSRCWRPRRSPLAFGVLARLLLEKLDPAATLVLVLAAIMLAASHIVARPHALALPVMVLWIAGLVRALDARRAPSWWLLPLMTLWANLHGGFTFGLAADRRLRA